MSKSAAAVTPHTAVKVLSNVQDVSDAVVYNPFTWGKSHKEYDVITQSYEYLHVSDAAQTASQMQQCASALWGQIQTDLADKTQMQQDIVAVFARHYQCLGIPYTQQALQREVATALSACVVAPVVFDEMPNFEQLQQKYQKRVRKEERKQQLKDDLAQYMESLTTYLVAQLGKALQTTEETYTQAHEEMNHRFFMNARGLLHKEMQRISETERVLRKYDELQEVLARYYVAQ